MPHSERKKCIDDDYRFTPEGRQENQDCLNISIHDDDYSGIGNPYLEEKLKKRKDNPEYYKGKWWEKEAMSEPPNFLEQQAIRFGEPGFLIDESMVANCRKCYEGDKCDSLDIDEDGVKTLHDHHLAKRQCSWILGGGFNNGGREGSRIFYKPDGSLTEQPSLPITLVSRVVQRPDSRRLRPDGTKDPVNRPGAYISHIISELCKDDTLMPNSPERTKPTFKSDCELIANPPDLGPPPGKDPVAAARRAKELAQQNVTTAENELTKLKAALLKAEQKLADAKTALAEAEKALKDAIEAQSKQLIVFQDNLKAAETKFTTAQAQFETVNQELQKLKEQLTSVETKVKTADTAKALAEKAVLEAKNKLSQFQGNGPVTAQAAPQESNSGAATQIDSSVTEQAASQESNSDTATEAESSQPTAGDSGQESPSDAN
jgi:hypothetical protein